MKFRLDFVTNSSSSSYICEVCGQVESGWDLGLSEAQMYECANGHTFCENHVHVSFDRKDLLIELANDMIKKCKERTNSIVSDRYWKERLEGAEEDLAKVEGMDESEIEDTIEEYEYRYQFPTSLCPICSFQELSDTDLVQYMLKKYNTNRTEILAEMRRVFGDYDSFKEKIREDG